ncbi:hypothetical protein Leryth_008005 [Lithospermum erythrorhizon]|nr:hypothetical protein Leryth_008005 [Lithospermum erythrorhizon]
MSAHRRPSAHPMRINSTTNNVVVSVKYSCSPAVYHEGVFRMPIFVRNSGINIPAAPNIAHLQCTSSACAFHLKVSGSDPVAESRPRGSKPKSPGGVLPGNQRGLSGSAAAQTVVTDRLPDGAENLLTLNCFPPMKEFFVAATIAPFFWVLQGI